MIFDIISIKERIAIDESLTPDERSFVLDCINEATAPPKPKPVVAHDPGNYMGRIEAMWAAFSVDDGGEGLCAMPMGNVTIMPLIAADRQMFESRVLPAARDFAKLFNKPVRIVKFTKREDVEIYRP